MVTRRLGISEARRLLPELVRSVAADGGRVDITYRGKPQVSLLRISDVKGPRSSETGSDLDPALRLVLKVPDDDLIEVIRNLRAREGHPRMGWLSDGEPTTPGKKKPSAKQRRKRNAR